MNEKQTEEQHDFSLSLVCGLVDELRNSAKLLRNSLILYFRFSVFVCRLKFVLILVAQDKNNPQALEPEAIRGSS